MPLPKVVYLGAADYDVKEKKKLDLPQLLGETNNENCEILIRDKQAPPSKRDTFLHEILHAIFWLSGANHSCKLSEDDEEVLVRFLAPWLLAFMRDNPHALTFLLEN